MLHTSRLLYTDTYIENSTICTTCNTEGSNKLCIVFSILDLFSGIVSAPAAFRSARGSGKPGPPVSTGRFWPSDRHVEERRMVHGHWRSQHACSVTYWTDELVRDEDSHRSDPLKGFCCSTGHATHGVSKRITVVFRTQRASRRFRSSVPSEGVPYHPPPSPAFCSGTERTPRDDD